MNSSIGNLSLASKAQQISSASLNIQSSISIDQQASQQRNSFGGGNSNNSNGGAGGGARNQASPRNIQGSKTKHKNHRKPSMQRDDVIAEAIAMNSISASRKGRTSITHLMDWSVPHPRPQHGHNSHARGHHGNRRTPSWGQGSGYHAIDKARYVNANYRFIVDPTGDYRPQSLDPDSTLPWTSILQILASSITQFPSCPICLCDPVAPRMARCGHIFCLPCLIRYMASEDSEASKQGQHFGTNNQNKPKWKKCPICYDSIYMNEVRPVKFYTGQEVPAPREGEDVTLRLMMRQPGSTLALPKDVASNMPVLKRKGSIGDGKEDVDSIPWHYAVEVTDYARIMKGTREYLKEEYEREITELEEQERVDELMFGDETDWVQKAIGKIKSALEKTQELPGKEQEKHEKISARELYEQHLREEAEARAELNKQRQKIVQQTDVEVPEMYLMTSSGAQNGMDHENLPSASVTSPMVETPTTPQIPAPRSPTRHRAPKPIDTHDPTQPYFFYQALPHSYLSPLDIRILKVAFGSFAAFPSSVLPRVENFSMGHVVDDELRKRAKYLSHLPYGCEVAFLECDWTDIVPADVLEKFSTDLERRRRRKREKDNREERDRVRAEREEDEKRWSGARRTAPGRGDGAAGEDELGLAMEMSRRGVETVTEEEDLDSGVVSNGPRFGFGSLPQSSPPNSRTVWGTPVVSGEEASKQYSAVLEEKKDTGWLEGWDRGVDAADQAAIAAAMASSSATGGGGAKGKKKFKKVTLMTNTGKRGA
ncbi:hypothetical protein TWF730_009154 [Orbilia blumenaviensis]|uniref:RING-type domain-containing protein n=1 Tax=Orbilia blumenaviensis TaxID=1796055 RepID=A0AAV9UYQ2_9PEZI